MDSTAAIKAEQAAWASSAGHHPDHDGYLAEWQQNVAHPLSQSARAAFDEGAGSELHPSSDSRPKMTTLHSSAALAVNVFDYWTGQSLDAISTALNLTETPLALAFESTFSTGLRGTAPTLDIALNFANSQVLGVESKFTEWLTQKSHRGNNFTQSYFPGGAGLWSQAGLMQAQALVSALRQGEEQFAHLDVAQLLKHMLGLATQHSGSASLYYLFYDWPAGRESAQHRAEIERFSQLVGTDFPFQWGTYQDAFTRLAKAFGQSRGPYMQYLRQRYFHGAV